MGLLPTGRVLVVIEAVPFVTVEVPSTVEPFVNVTVPVTPEGKVSVKVTEPPAVEGFWDDVRVEVGFAFETICVAVPVAGSLVESPP